VKILIFRAGSAGGPKPGRDRCYLELGRGELQAKHFQQLGRSEHARRKGRVIVVI
jgi:hypothetical protein